MAFKKKYKQTGVDTTAVIGGFLKAGWHTVTITKVIDLDTTLVVDFQNGFEDKHTDRIFVVAKDGKNYSGKLADLLSSLPEELIKEIVEGNDFARLEGSKVRVKIARTSGNYIRKIKEGFVIESGGGRSNDFPTIGEARAALDAMGNKAYLRAVEYGPEEQKEETIW